MLSCLCYNLKCLDEQNTGALFYPEAALAIQKLSILGKAPSMCGLTSLAVRLGNGSAHGGHFVMSDQGDDWEARIYHPAEYDLAAWNNLAAKIKFRDKYRCGRCKCSFKKNELTVHHLTPRAEGGSDDPKNLISLCRPCHDIVEDKHLTTAKAIRQDYYLEKDDKIKVKVKKVIDDGTIDWDDWHVWVYGAGHKKL